MINREVYEKDPSLNKLLNQGVAKVTSGVETHELETLRYEITNFVCDGQYAKGLERILRSYLSNLDKPEQPGVWVSGFYGSGKSHLVKVLQYLWNDYEFPDGARSRGLAKVTESIKDQMVELSTQAKRKGGLHAAAGTSGLGGGWQRATCPAKHPVQVGRPAFSVRKGVIPPLAPRRGPGEAGQESCSGCGTRLRPRTDEPLRLGWHRERRPGGSSRIRRQARRGRMLLQKQFPNVTDISTDDMIEKIRQVFGGKKAKLPRLLIVLDEVQQYIGERPSVRWPSRTSKSGAVRGSVRTFSSSRRDRTLSRPPRCSSVCRGGSCDDRASDTDVEQVTREIVLKKNPAQEPKLKGLLDTHSGEIERHLSASKIASMPVTAVCWCRIIPCCPFADDSGSGSCARLTRRVRARQLRTQLWIVHDAVEKTADLDLGHVVDAAFIYDHIKSRVIQSGVSFRRSPRRSPSRTHEEDGELRFQLCALIFLIGRLPHGGPNDAGIRANAETLADLMVTDLTRSSTELRKRVPELLEKLVASGTVLRVENEYRMQTREGSEWNQAYQAAMSKLQNDPGKLASAALSALEDLLHRGAQEAQADPRREQGGPQLRAAFRC